MKTKIETINGKQCTVIRKPFDAEWVRIQEEMRQMVWVEHYCDGKAAFPLWLATDRGGFAEHPEYWRTLSYLPPLPRFPERKHDPLIYLYKAHGIFPVIEDLGNNWLVDGREEITHATDIAGNRVDVAISEAV